MMIKPLIVNAMQRPDSLPDLSSGSWDMLVRQARRANLLASLALRLPDDSPVRDAPPEA